MTRVCINDRPISKEDARKAIEKNGYVLLAKDKDSEIWGSADESFREYAKKNNVKTPDNIGMTTLTDLKEYIK